MGESLFGHVEAPWIALEDTHAREACWIAFLPVLQTVIYVECPEAQCPRPPVSQFSRQALHTAHSWILHLNDEHRWSREDIADWLDTLDLDLRVARPDPSRFQKNLGTLS